MAHHSKGSARAASASVILDASSWESFLNNQPAANPNKTVIIIPSGKVVILAQRYGEEDLLLRANLEPFSTRLAAVSVKVSIELHFPQDANVSQIHVEIKDRLTHLTQGDCGTVLAFIPLSWNLLSSNVSPPQINVSMIEIQSLGKDEFPLHWMGLSPVQPRATFYVDLNSLQLPSSSMTSSSIPSFKSEDILKVWRCIVNRTYGTWWLWLPPLELSTSTSGSPTHSQTHGLLDKLGKPFRRTPDSHTDVSTSQSTFIVAYLMRREELNNSLGSPHQEFHILVKASLYRPVQETHSHSHKTESKHKIVKIVRSELSVKRKGSNHFTHHSSELSQVVVNDTEKEAAHYDEIAQFIFERDDWDNLDPHVAPTLSISIE